MSRYSEMSALASAWERRVAGRISVGDSALRAWAEENASFWRRMMSGAITTRQLRRLGHPFGRGSSPAQREAGYRSMRGAPPARIRSVLGRTAVPPLPINAQTGRLRASVRVRKAGEQDYRVGAATPYAKYILSPTGTRLMVGRGFLTGRNLPNPGPVGEAERYARLTARTVRRILTGT